MEGDDSKKILYIRSTIRNVKESYKADRQRHKITALGLKLSTAFLAAIATVLLGWQSSSHSVVFQNLALSINALITVIATYEAFFRPKKLWVRETKVLSAIKDLERNFEFDVLDNATSEDKLNDYKNKVNCILNESLEEWIEDRENEG